MTRLTEQVFGVPIDATVGRRLGRSIFKSQRL
jgi:hypothetical protein